MRKFTRGSVVFKRGDPVDGIWMIIEGEFENLWTDSSRMKSMEKLGKHSQKVPIK